MVRAAASLPVREKFHAMPIPLSNWRCVHICTVFHTGVLEVCADDRDVRAHGHFLIELCPLIPVMIAIAVLLCGRPVFCLLRSQVDLPVHKGSHLQRGLQAEARGKLATQSPQSH